MRNKGILVAATLAMLATGLSPAFSDDGDHSQQNQANQQQQQQHGDQDQQDQMPAYQLPNQDQQDPQRHLNVGNYRQLDPGMNPVVIRGIRGDQGSGSGLSQIGSGKVYTASSTDTTPITYKPGAPILTSPTPYLIWYGSWNSAHPALSPATNDYYNFTNTLLTKLGLSTRWSGIIKNYYSRPVGTNTAKTYVGSLNQAHNFFVPTNTKTYGTTLSQSAIYKIVKSVAPTFDPNGIYMVITSSNIPVTGFNTGNIQFCGWHSYSGTQKYGFVGDPANATWCQSQSAPTPNGNVGADAMASILTHEIEEATTDPLLNAWWSSTSTGEENADKCAWTWGPTTGSTSISNYTWTGTSYLIQQEFKLNSPATSSTSTLDTFSGVCAQ